jgi:hypothetical protein
MQITRYCAMGKWGKVKVTQEDFEQIAEVIYEHNFLTNYSEEPKDGLLIR